jgi:hypothetical protein
MNIDSDLDLFYDSTMDEKARQKIGEFLGGLPLLVSWVRDIIDPSWVDPSLVRENGGVAIESNKLIVRAYSPRLGIRERGVEFFIMSPHDRVVRYSLIQELDCDRYDVRYDASPYGAFGSTNELSVWSNADPIAIAFRTNPLVFGRHNKG